MLDETHASTNGDDKINLTKVRTQYLVSHGVRPHISTCKWARAQGPHPLFLSFAPDRCAISIIPSLNLVSLPKRGRFKARRAFHRLSGGPSVQMPGPILRQ